MRDQRGRDEQGRPWPHTVRLRYLTAITDEALTTALAVVRSAKVSELIAEFRAEEGLRPGGFAPWLDEEKCLAVLLALAISGHATTHTNATCAIFWGMSARALEMLGLDLSAVGPEQGYHRWVRSLRRYRDLVDPHPGDKGRRLTPAEHQAELSAYSDEFRESRVARGDRVVNALLQASVLTLPPDVLASWTGNVAIDSTLVRANDRFGTPTKRKPTLCGLEANAAWYVRDGEHAPSDGQTFTTSDMRNGKVGWGWEGHLVTMCPNDPTRASNVPRLLLGMTMSKPSRKPAWNGTKALRAIVAGGFPANFCAGDLAYGKLPRPENWALPLLELGYRKIFDVRENDLGKHEFVGGLVLLETNLYCPSILSRPELVFAVRDHRVGPNRDGKDCISDQELDRRIEARRAFLAHRNGRTNADGSARFMCPAATNQATLDCPLRPQPEPVTPEEMEAAGRRIGLTVVQRSEVPALGERGKVCQGAGHETVRPDAAFPRGHQDLLFESPEWRAFYGTMRNIIEGTNGQLKDDRHAALAAPLRRPMRGQAMAALATAILGAAMNLDQINRFLLRPVVPDSRGRMPVKQSRKRGRARELSETYLEQRQRRLRERAERAAA